MLIKNPAYRPGSLADTLLEDGEVLVGTIYLLRLKQRQFQRLFHELAMEILLETFLIIHDLVIQL